MALRPALMLEELREHLEDLPKPLPWHSRIALAVGYVTLAVGLVAIVTAIPGDLAGVLAVENLRTTRKRDAFGDPIVRSVLCNVRNVGISTVTRYVVNYSVMTP
ncbi:MAG TPA: hypothetical protein VFP66_08620 [Candidatus Limnocylindrales bacterium]|nr:hypothetical protein [Candidatus Limnocylindrales bacterium]